MTELKSELTAVSPVLRRLSVIEYDNIYAEREHSSRTHEFLCILNGSMKLHLGENLLFTAMPGDLLLVPAQVPHRDEFVFNKGLRVLFISFEWPLPEYFETVNNRALLNMHYDVRSEVLRRLEFMRANWSDEPDTLRSASVQLHGILLLLYFGIVHFSAEQKNEKKPPLKENMRRAKHFIDQNHGTHITLEETARFVGMSPPYFSKLFHDEFGVGFSAYLTAVRLSTARHFLQNTSLQVSEIADKCGFSSSSYFIRIFTRHYGVSPKNYSRSPSGKKGL